MEKRIERKSPTAWEKREQLRDKGQFWTPAWVAEAMVAYVARRAALVYDPGCGEGAFFEALLALDDATARFYGTDSDAQVLKASVYQNARCEAEQRDFIRNPPRRKFAAVVGNPPYIRHHRIDEETKKCLKHLCRKITGFDIDGRAGYHVYFLLQALNLLETGGRLAFIMPADVCEGVFAAKLWHWIAARFRLEAVVTFAEAAAPFTGVDTNALIFFIENSEPKDSFRWSRVAEKNPTALLDFVTGDFRHADSESIEAVNRQLDEAVSTGLSRPPQAGEGDDKKFRLGDFADVMRGIVTGANEYFFLTKRQTESLGIPNDFLQRAVGRAGDIAAEVLTAADLDILDGKNRPTYLLSISEEEEQLPKTIADYLAFGKESGLPERAFIKQRQPWYRMERRRVPPLLFAYLGKRSTRFIKNAAGALPLTSFLCVYPFDETEEKIERLRSALNHPETLENLKLVGKSYGSGAIKVEPGNLKNLVIPASIVQFYELNTAARRFQARLF